MLQFGVDVHLAVASCQFKGALAVGGVVVPGCDATLVRASENEGAIQHGLSAVYPFGFMCQLIQLVIEEEGSYRLFKIKRSSI